MRFIAYSSLVWAALFLLGACDENEPPLDEELKTRILLDKSWETAYVTIDGTDVTDLGYSLMVLTFDREGGWTSQNANGLFAASGSWQFVAGSNGPNINRITMGDKEVDLVLNPEGSTLTLRLERDGSEVIGGRGKQAGGSYEIYLLPKFTVAE